MNFEELIDWCRVNNENISKKYNLYEEKDRIFKRPNDKEAKLKRFLIIIIMESFYPEDYDAYNKRCSISENSIFNSANFYGKKISRIFKDNFLEISLPAFSKLYVDGEKNFCYWVEIFSALNKAS